MKLFKPIKYLAWLSVIPLLGLSLSVYALGTSPGTNITNTATLSYTIGGTAQPNINSNTRAFVVDNRLDFVVATTDVARVGVAPGQTGAVLTFTVTNTGNSTQDYSLTPTNNGTDPFGGTDNFDPSAFSVFVEDGTTPGGYQPLEDTATYIDELSSINLANQVTVYIVSTIPAAQANGSIAAVTLSAQVAVGGTGATQGADITTDDSGIVDDPATVQTVFGDGVGDTDLITDGLHSDTSAYEVQAASLSVNKTSSVRWDPINNTTNPKAIPGAAVSYSIAISNAGPASANLTQITDALAATLAFDADLTTNNLLTAESAAGSGIRVDQTSTRPLGVVPATAYYTTTNGDADAASHDGSATGGTVAIDLALALPADAGTSYAAGELKNGETVTITFQVIVQ